MNFGIYDLIVIISYISLVTVVGLYFSSTKSTKDFFLAGNNLPWYFIMFSIIATETSSLTFLNIPGISYKTDFSFMQVAFGFILGRIFVSFFILPMYFKDKYISVYQWIGENLGKATQKSISGIFLITRVLGDGVRLYATAIPITFIMQGFLGTYLTDLEISVCTLLLISFTTILYTVYGGFKTVVATDTIQFVVYIAGGIYSLWFLSSVLNSSGLDIQTPIIVPDSKFSVYHGFEGNLFTSPYFFINGIIGGIFISIGSHGVDQMFVQRLLACENLKDSRKALIGSGFFVFIQFLLFLWIGNYLFQFYQNTEIQQDKVFSKFIVEQIPSPIIGLLVAAVLASAMSTLSSSINSMSLSFIVDIQNRDTNLDSTVKSSKITSIFWGMILFLSSLLPYLLSEKIAGGLVDLGLKISSFTFGPLIGIFILARLPLRKVFQSQELVFSIFLTVLCTIIINLIFKPALGWIVPMGILEFFVFLGIARVKQRFFPHTT